MESEVNVHTPRKLDKTLNDLLAQGHSRLVLDASLMGFISSAGLRAILSAQQEACSRGGEVRVCGLNPQTRRIFEMARLDECLRLTDTRQEAWRVGDVAQDTCVLTTSNNITCPAESAGSKPISRKDLWCMQCHNLPCMYSAILPVNGVLDRELVECVQERDSLP